MAHPDRRKNRWTNTVIAKIEAAPASTIHEVEELADDALSTAAIS